MKKIMLIAAVAVSVFITASEHAQVSVNVNFGTQPVWGPTGYDHLGTTRTLSGIVTIAGISSIKIIPHITNG